MNIVSKPVVEIGRPNIVPSHEIGAVSTIVGVSSQAENISNRNNKFSILFRFGIAKDFFITRFFF